MFKFMFVVSLICSIVLFVFIFIDPSIGIYFIAPLLSAIIFGLLMQMQNRISQIEQDIASLKTDTKNKK